LTDIRNFTDIDFISERIATLCSREQTLLARGFDGFFGTDTQVTCLFK